MILEKHCTMAEDDCERTEVRERLWACFPFLLVWRDNVLAQCSRIKEKRQPVNATGTTSKPPTAPKLGQRTTPPKGGKGYGQYGNLTIEGVPLKVPQSRYTMAVFGG